MPQTVLLFVVLVQVLVVMAVFYLEKGMVLQRATRPFDRRFPAGLSPRRVQSERVGHNSPRAHMSGCDLADEPLFATWGSGPLAELPNSRMSESQVRAQFYLHAEALQTEIDGVRATALFLSGLDSQHDDENLGMAARELLSLHGRLMGCFSGLVAVFREAHK